jgi:RimJ/RimL family protein N-acetyltransferase
MVVKILETKRLTLREIVQTDDKFILDILNQPSFIKYIGDRKVRNLAQAAKYIESRFTRSYNENGFGMYLVELKTNNEPIGLCGFVKRDSLPEADIGFAFLPQFEKNGYALESAAAMMKYGREKLNLKRVLAITTQDNESSVRLLEKLNFKFNGLITQPGDTQELNLFYSDS